MIAQIINQQYRMFDALLGVNTPEGCVEIKDAPGFKFTIEEIQVGEWDYHIEFVFNHQIFDDFDTCGDSEINPESIQITSLLGCPKEETRPMKQLNAVSEKTYNNIVAAINKDIKKRPDYYLHQMSN